MGQRSTKRYRVSESLPDLRVEPQPHDSKRISFSAPDLRWSEKTNFINRIRNPTEVDDYEKLKHDLTCHDECINRRSEYVMLNSEEILEKTKNACLNWSCPICAETPLRMFTTRCIHLICHNCTYNLIKNYGEYQKVHFICPICMGLCSKFDLIDISSRHLYLERYVIA